MTNEQYAKDYVHFMCNPKNLDNCNECPTNQGIDCESGRPCGQQRCWVELHCDNEEGTGDEEL